MEHKKDDIPHPSCKQCSQYQSPCLYNTDLVLVQFYQMPTSARKRPSLEAIPAASSSSSNLQLRHQSLSLPLYPLFASLVFHIVPAKLENNLGVLYQSIEDLGGRCDGLEGCRWVVTALKGRARLKRVLGEWIVCLFYKRWADE
jgi:hypothetical protein